MRMLGECPMATELADWDPKIDTLIPVSYRAPGAVGGAISIVAPAGEVAEVSGR